MDIVAEAGFQVPMSREVRVTMAAPGTITVSFTKASGSPEGPAVYALAVAHVLPSSSPTVAPTMAPTLPPSPAVRFTPGSQVVDGLGRVWESDVSYLTFGGNGDTIRAAEYITFSAQMDANLEPMRAVFDVERQSDRIEYTLSVGDEGSYQVNVYLLEAWYPTAGDRTFTVTLQGVPMLRVDLSDQVGFRVATVVKSTAQVTAATGRALHIGIVQDDSSPNFAVVHGIEVVPVQVVDVVRINCGGPTVVDDVGRTWNADTFYQPGGDVVTPSQYITVNLAPGTITDNYGAVLATERWSNVGMGSLQYVIRPPEAGTYRLQFVFAEVWHRVVGTRLFDVSVNGNIVFSRLDVLAEAGFQRPILKEVTFDVDETRLASGIEVVILPDATAPEGPAVYGIALLRHISRVSSGTLAPTNAPTDAPTKAPSTSTPTTAMPSTQPPTQGQTFAPSHIPTFTPSTVMPSAQPPTQGQTFAPSRMPTAPPSTAKPTVAPTEQPTSAPTPSSSAPSRSPTLHPTHTPTAQPTSDVTRTPTASPTDFSPTVLRRINCGGPSVVDGLGNTWESDSRLRPGGFVVSPTDYTSVNLVPNGLSTSYVARYSVLSFVLFVQS